MKLVLVMPESMSIERRRLMAAYGAQLELTPRAKGMPGAIARAQEMVAADSNAWMPSQFDNPANIAVHEETTALEILVDMPGGPDVYITGVGTGGHLTVGAFGWVLFEMTINAGLHTLDLRGYSPRVNRAWPGSSSGRTRT